MDQKDYFLNQIKILKNSKSFSIALPEVDDERIRRVILDLLEIELIDKIVGFCLKQEKKDLESLFASNKIRLYTEDDLKDQTFTFLQERNAGKHKESKEKKQGKDIICSQSLHPLYQAGVLLQKGEIDAVVAGATYPTKDVIRAALKTIPLAEGIKTISGSFILQKKEEFLLFADCGVVIEPTPEELADIAYASYLLFKKIFPHLPAQVAFLSFSTKKSANHPLADKTISAYEIFRNKHPQIICDGEMQFDAAFDPKIRARKIKNSPILGRASIYIFPDLNAANIGYKIAQRLGGYVACGPLLQGFSKPYSDLSRGATPEDIKQAAYINLLLTCDAKVF